MSEYITDSYKELLAKSTENFEQFQEEIAMILGQEKFTNFQKICNELYFSFKHYISISPSDTKRRKIYCKFSEIDKDEQDKLIIRDNLFDHTFRIHLGISLISMEENQAITESIRTYQVLSFKYSARLISLIVFDTLKKIENLIVTGEIPQEKIFLLFAYKKANQKNENALQKAIENNALNKVIRFFIKEENIALLYKFLRTNCLCLKFWVLFDIAIEYKPQITNASTFFANLHNLQQSVIMHYIIQELGKPKQQHQVVVKMYSDLQSTVEDFWVFYQIQSHYQRNANRTFSLKMNKESKMFHRFLLAYFNYAIKACNDKSDIVWGEIGLSFAVY
jgi:hypothetical protein